MVDAADKVTVPVEVISLAGELPLVAEGRLRERDDGLLEVRVDRSPAGMAAGSRLVLNFPGTDRPRLVAEAVEVRGNIVVCRPRHVREPERREFPRLVAGLSVRYRVLDPAEVIAETAAWLRGDEEPAGRGRWVRPDELMNFSVTGLRFDAEDERVAEGDLLLLELAVPGRGGPWRCTARVRRVSPPDPAEVDGEVPPALRQVAVAFEQVPAEAQEALGALTLEIQEALL